MSGVLVNRYMLNSFSERILIGVLMGCTLNYCPDGLFITFQSVLHLTSFLHLTPHRAHAQLVNRYMLNSFSERILIGVLMGCTLNYCPDGLFITFQQVTVLHLTSFLHLTPHRAHAQLCKCAFIDFKYIISTW